MQIMTFREFIKQWESDEGAAAIIAPVDYETRNPHEIGTIVNGQWSPIAFSPALKDLAGAYVRSQILEYCQDFMIELTEEQLQEACKGVGYAISEMIGDCIDTALDILDLDREIVVLDAWATPAKDMEYGDVYTSLIDAIANSNLPEEALLKGYTVSGGKGIRSLVEELFKDFHYTKEEIMAIIVENGLTKYVNDQSEE
jgi:hypothetical protein